ncbi:hypothetical protein J2S00_003299 [Caldalkalibacillus uzonensis]|uniref:Uncharacterized protein n=1 Tax=Caldalkalibacillus uzonensis TaxID=353224 RepID=A0ABU0CVX4_9BACI|nr:hypothetical protein [Caldalkalibacillus uzonensis]
MKGPVNGFEVTESETHRLEGFIITKAIEPTLEPLGNEPNRWPAIGARVDILFPCTVVCCCQTFCAEQGVKKGGTAVLPSFCWTEGLFCLSDQGQKRDG